MTRKKVAVTPPNYAEHRDRWAGLIGDVHHAVASGDPAALNSLASRANAAECMWTMAAPYPRGLVCRVLARTAYAWSRQSGAEARAALTPLLMASVGLVDALLAEMAGPVEAAMRAEDAAAAFPEGVPSAAARLPYSEG